MKIKKIFILALSLVIVLGMTGMPASAEGDVASIDGTPYATLAAAVTAANAMDGDVTITLLQDTTFNEMMTISNNITIEGAYTITRFDDEVDNTNDYTGGLFTVDADKSLTLSDLTIDGNNNWEFDDEAFYQAAINATSQDPSVFYTLEENAPIATVPMIVMNGSVTLNNATIRDNVYKGLGSGSIFNGQVGSSLTLTGATITYCANIGYSQTDGKEIGQNTVLYTEGNEFIINEGTVISNNFGNHNGNLFNIINNCTMTMNGGKIINNRGCETGGIIILRDGGKFIMNDGEISGNAVANGIQAAITAKSVVYLHTDGNMIMNGGVIKENIAYDSTVFLYQATSSLEVYGGSIVNNTVVTGKDEIYNQKNGFAALYGGEYTSDVSELCAPGFKLYPIDEDDDGEADIYAVIKMIEIEFEDVSDPNAEIERLYNINLKTPDDTNLINKLEYIDLTFAFEETVRWTGYEINAVNENIDVHMVNNITPRYEFRFDEIDTPLAETDKITIGQAKFTGYGEYTFAVDATADTNAAYIRDDVEDELIDTYLPVVVAGEGYLDIEDLVHEIVPIPKRNLTINIMFPNDIEYKTAEYQKMTVKIAGGTVGKIINLGNESFDETADGLTQNPATVTLVDTNTDDGYSIAINLPYETTYTVIVEGAGYRTARYSVNLTENKTLNFWNNVKNEETEVEVGHPDVKVKQNFLAGDIIKDDNINIYDMSAILSYFGARDISETNNPDYIKYDINRDGVIDAKDVAYILVSWGN